MFDYTINRVFPRNKAAMAQVDRLLLQEGITRDGNLDYTCAIYDQSGSIIATGSCFGQTLRCLAVSREHQGEGLMNKLVSHLTEIQYSRGNTHLFVYTKVSAAPLFGDLGFQEIARVEDKLVFLENRHTGFSDTLARFAAHKKPGCSAALVMNANPFTLGHQYLAEQAAKECDTLHLFVLSEDQSLFPFRVRRELVRRGVAHIPNVVVHDSGPYIISSATFPSYFLKDEATVSETHAKLDLAVFGKIAEALNITTRFVGEEPLSQVTARYNRIMTQSLPEKGIECRILPRKEWADKPISASLVRKSIQTGDWATVEAMVPATTLEWLRSPEAAEVIEAIRKSANVIHH